MPHIDPERELVGWSLSPIYSDPDPTPPGYMNIATAAVMTCIATGQAIAGNGGPGYALSAPVVEALDNRQRHRSDAPLIIVPKDQLLALSRHAWKASDPELHAALKSLFTRLGFWELSDGET
jgi:hypothetical protein